VHAGHGHWVDMRNRGAVFDLGFTSSVDRASEGSGAKVESGSGHLVFTSKSYKQYATVAIELGEEDKSRHDHTHGTQGCVVHADYTMDHGFVPRTVVHGRTTRWTTQEVTSSNFLRSPSLILSIVMLIVYFSSMKHD
jgi:hypothetical protein